MVCKAGKFHFVRFGEICQGILDPYPHHRILMKKKVVCSIVCRQRLQ